MWKQKLLIFNREKVNHDYMQARKYQIYHGLHNQQSHWDKCD